MSDGVGIDEERPSVTVVVVVYGEEPLLENCINAITGSVGIIPEVVIVENGGSEEIIATLEVRHRLRVIRPGRNTGFAEGCNLGVSAGSVSFVALVNPDAIVEPTALRELVRGANHPDGRVVTASIRLAHRPEIINSSGTEITFLGLSWAAHFGEVALSGDAPRFVAGANGGALACRRSTWDTLGGLCSEMFVYYEDADFSIRAWHRGIPVVFIPSAVTLHAYEFSKNKGKFFFLERNRLMSVLTCFELKHLLVTLPMHVVIECGLIAFATREGWLGEKLRAYRWVLANLQWIRHRRTALQQVRVADMGAFYDVLSTGMFPGNLPSAHPPMIVNRIMAGYWNIARRIIGR